MDIPRDRIIFLGGCPRSGTTLVQNMLDSHPDVLGGPEFLHLVDILKLRSRLRTSVDKEWINLFCSNDDVDGYIRQLIDALLLPIADRENAKYLSEKSPDNVLVLEDIAELYPNAKVVHIVRDPRAVLASLLKAGARAKKQGEAPAPFTRSTQAAIRYISRCLRAGFRASNRFPEQVYTLVYEELVSNPHEEAKKLCTFLNLTWSESMLFPAEQKHLGEAAITVNSKEIWYDKETYYSNPNTARLAAWQNELAKHQQILANRAFRKIPELRDMTYDWTIERHSNPLISIYESMRAYGLLVCGKIRDVLSKKLLETS